MAREPQQRGSRNSSPANRSSSTARVTNPGAVIDIPHDINRGLSSAKRSTMIAALGLPRDHFDNKCRPAKNDPVKSLLVTEDVGPFKVTGIRPAVSSLRSVLDNVRGDQIDVYNSLGTAGMFCARLISGSSNPSNHSWGCAVDISIDGVLDGLGSGKKDGKTLAGLAAMAPFFNEAGWYWGVGFSSFEDGMHFEVADQTIRTWHADGAFGDRELPEVNLSIGDVGREVREMQEALASLGFDIIADGFFGQITHSIVMDFQASKGLKPDGIVGPRTREALGF